MTLLSVTSTINNNHLIKINRKLTAEDLDLSFTQSDKDVRFAGKKTSKFLVGCLNNAIVSELVSSFKLTVNEIGVVISPRSLSSLLSLDGENIGGREDFVVLAESPTKLKGVKRQLLQSEYDMVLSKVEEEAEANYTKSLESLVALFNEKIDTVAKITNNDFYSLLKSLVVYGEINNEWLDHNLNNDEKVKILAAAEKEKEIDAQIEELKKQKEQAAQLIYYTKRECVTSKLKTVLCADGLKALDDLQDVDREKKFSDLLFSK